MKKPTSIKHLPVATAHLHLPLRGLEIDAFRKAVNRVMGRESDLLHNHELDSSGLKYRYPLVQYKAIGGEAAIIGLGEGAAVLRELWRRRPVLPWKGTDWPLSGTLEIEALSLHIGEERNAYQVRNWMALNEKNSQRWDMAPNLLRRLEILEKTLVAHVLKFASGVQWLLPPRSLEVSLQDCRESKTRWKETRFRSFDISFRTNLQLPAYVGLGKATAHGFGTVTPLPESRWPKIQNVL
ncbi:MAG: CRISPR-associated endonuclease Cas6 [Bacteroidota bacterium]